MNATSNTTAAASAILPNGRGYTVIAQEDSRVLADFGNGAEWEDWDRPTVAGHVAAFAAYMAGENARQKERDLEAAVAAIKAWLESLTAPLASLWDTNSASGVDYPPEIRAAAKDLAAKYGAGVRLPSSERIKALARIGAIGVATPVADVVAAIRGKL